MATGRTTTATDNEWLVEQFERWCPQLRSVAYGMLGSVSEADDAVQESWLRLVLAVLDPDVVFRADGGPKTQVPTTRGAKAVAARVLSTAPRFIHLASPVLVNGQAGALLSDTKAVGVIGFTIVDGLIAAIDIVADPAKLTQVNIPPYNAD